MRVLQLIDSLEAGGAERMAVNYANSLSRKIEFSALIATRKEGQLVSQIDEKVSYLFLNRKKVMDLSAIFRLRNYIKENKIEIVHAHSSSFFIATLVKITFSRVKIVWHDHYGSRTKESIKQNRVLVLCSAFFSSIFVVNLQLRKWSENNMFCKKIFFIPNFSLSFNESYEITKLKGTDGKRIVFLANLKKPKNHILILKAFTELKLNEFGWSLHLIGKDYNDSYSDKLKSFVVANSLENHIHLYGGKKDIKYILSQSSIGVLASTEEGFPVTLLEYALSNLAVISTNVGYCSEIIKDSVDGFVFDPLSEFELIEKLKKITEDGRLRQSFANSFNNSVRKNYSEKVIIQKLVSAYKTVYDEK